MKLYHDTQRNLLIYETNDPAPILQHIPNAKRLNGQYVAVPHNLHNNQILRLLQYPVVSPLASYDFPIMLGRRPCDHQKATANFLAVHPRAFCLSDPGTMKTLSALWAADFVMRDFESRDGQCRALVLAPLSIIEDAWGAEISRNFLGRRTYSVVYGSQKQRLAAIDKDADFYLLNYDGLAVGSQTRPIRLGGVAARLSARMDIKLVIVDEARNYHDATTRRHRLLRAALGGRPYWWLLTGTPTSNGPLDAYGQAKLVNGAKGLSFTGWRAMTMMQISQFKWVPQRGAAERVRELLSPAIRYSIEDIWDGPEMTVETRAVELTPDQNKLIREVRNGFVMELANGKQITAINEASVRGKILQIAMGAVYDADHNWHAVPAEPRKNELLQIVRECAGKILLFVPLTSIVRLLYIWLSDYKRGIINGATSPRDRQAIIRSFQDDPDGVRIIIADPGSLSLGANLFAGRLVCWYGPTDKTEQWIQGNKRVHRPGQKWPVTVTRLVATPMEREIYRRLEMNESMQGVVLKMVEEGKL